MEYAEIKDGILNVKPRHKFFTLHTKEVYSNFKLVFEYRFNKPNSYGKIAVFSSVEKAYSVMYVNQPTVNFTSGSIQTRIGVSPDWKFKYVFKPEEELAQEHNFWNRMEIICRGTNIKVIVNGHQTTDFETSLSEGNIIFMASDKADLTVRKLELFKLD